MGIQLRLHVQDFSYVYPTNLRARSVNSGLLWVVGYHTMFVLCLWGGVFSISVFPWFHPGVKARWTSPELHHARSIELSVSVLASSYWNVISDANASGSPPEFGNSLWELRLGVPVTGCTLMTEFSVVFRVVFRSFFVCLFFSLVCVGVFSSFAVHTVSYMFHDASLEVWTNRSQTWVFLSEAWLRMSTFPP